MRTIIKKNLTLGGWRRLLTDQNLGNNPKKNRQLKVGGNLQHTQSGENLIVMIKPERCKGRSLFRLS